MEPHQLRAEAEQLKSAIRDDRKAAARTTTLRLAPLDVEPIGTVQLRCRRTLRGHLSKVYALHWVADGGKVVSTSQDGTLIVWDTHRAREG